MDGVRRRSSAAFTLLELTVVLFILGLLAALLAPSFRGFFETSKSLEATSGIRQTIRMVQQRAANEGDVQVLHLDFETGAYFVVKKEDRHSFRRKKFEIRRALPENYVFYSVYFPEMEDEVRRDEARLEFYPDGTTSDAEIVIASLDENEKEEDYYLITIQGTTGHVSKPMKVDPDRL